MQVTADILNFKPPRPGRWGKPVALALVAHALLMAALTWGVHWKQDEPPVAFEAEIWSALPREAAPRAVQPPPPPPPEPEQVKPEPKPEPKPAPPPPQPTVKQPDIATEKAKKKLEEDKKRELEEDKKEKALKDKAEREKKEKELVDKKKVEDQKKLAEKKKQDQERKDAERREELAAENRRNENLARMMGQAGASGGPEARGTAQKSSGPSSGYGGKVFARLRPKIINSSNSPSNLIADIEVRSAPDGRIVSRRIVKSSGSAAWDEDALRAIDRMAVMPRDEDGSVPPTYTIGIRPTD